MPYLVNDERPPTGERHQTAEEVERIGDTTRCILCACCTSACPREINIVEAISQVKRALLLER